MIGRVAFTLGTVVAVSMTLKAGVSAGAWHYRPYEYEAWMLQQMKAEADCGILHFAYPGKFLALTNEPTAVWSAHPVEGLEPIPGEAGTPPHRRERPTVRVPVRFAAGRYDLGREDIGYVRAQAQTRPQLFVGESPAEVMNSDTNGFEQSTEMVADGTGWWRSGIPLALRYFRFGTPVESAEFLSQADWRESIGSFACSDPRKVRIWRLGVETLRLCTRTFLVDGIKRDRLPWAADLAVEVLAEAYSFGDPEPVKRTLAALGSGAPAKVGNVNGIASFSLWWVIAHDLLQRYFDEPAYLKLHYPRVRERLAEVATHEDERGFFARRLGWNFMDWTGRDSGQLKSEISLQVIYFGALTSGARLAARVGDAAAERIWRERAERLRVAILKAGMDKTRHSRILAIALGLVEGETARRYACEIAADDLPPTVTPYMASFEVMALVQCGEREAALRKLESVWGAMLDFGADAYWEGWDASDKGDEVYEYYGRPYAKSLCHAWSAGPAFLIPGWFLGVQPTEDGWQRWEMRPLVPEFAPDAQVTVPTKAGSVNVKIKNGQVVVE